MNNSWENINLKSLIENLRESINTFGGFSPEQVRKAASVNEETVTTAILMSLSKRAKTGNEILIDIEKSSNPKPKASSLYPLLENMVDRGLLKSEMKKDRKIFSLTDAGKNAAAKAENPTEEAEPSASRRWATPNWIDLQGELPIASKRLAGVALEVAQHGTKEQQKQAAAAIDEARRKLHEILAAE